MKMEDDFMYNNGKAIKQSQMDELLEIGKKIITGATVVKVLSESFKPVLETIVSKIIIPTINIVAPVATVVCVIGAGYLLIKGLFNIIS